MLIRIHHKEMTEKEAIENVKLFNEKFPEIAMPCREWMCRRKRWQRLLKRANVKK